MSDPAAPLESEQDQRTKRNLFRWLYWFCVIVFAVIFLRSCVPMGYFLYFAFRQAKAGRAYMATLKPDEIQAWIKRTDELLDKNAGRLADHPSSPRWPAIPVPAELQELKIIAVRLYRDGNADSVEYVWLGGIDHTNLVVTRRDNGSHSVVANPNDGHPGTILWPPK